MYENRFKGTEPFEDDLYTGTLKDLSKFLTENRNIENKMKTFSLASRPVSGFMMGAGGLIQVL